MGLAQHLASFAFCSHVLVTPEVTSAGPGAANMARGVQFVRAQSQPEHEAAA